MKIEVCDLCHKRVYELNKTKVIIKDHKGLTFDCSTVFPAKRRYEGVICDDCLRLLKVNAKKEEPC